MVVGVGSPIIPLTEELEIGRDYLFLDCKGEGVVVIVLVRVLILVISLHFFEVFDDLVKIRSSDLVKVGDLASFPFRPNG